MKTKKILLLTLLSAFLITISYGLYYINTALPIVNGYNAKILCSAAFISKRDIESIKKEDLGAFNYVTHNVDQANNNVTASVFGLFTRKAVYRDKLGCTLLSEEATEEGLKSQYPQQSLAAVANVKNIDLKRETFKNIDYEKLDTTISDAFLENQEGKKNTRAVVILYKGKIIAERYAPNINNFTPLLGWSMTKSMINALTGIMIKKGKLDLRQNNLFTEWSNDNRKNITLDQLMRMSSGLKFQEDYSKVCDATNMLFRSYDISKIPLNNNLETEPDSKWYYSSGTTNLISKLIRNTINDDTKYLELPYKELFSKLGMSTAIVEPDPSGTFIGSSFMYASARDWAKFGQLYLQNGVWNGEKIFPDNWVKYTSTPTPKAEQGKYGAQFWLNAGNSEGVRWESLPRDIFYPSGFESQYVFIIPSKDLVIVRLGQTRNEKNFDEEKLIKGTIDSFKN